MNKKLVSKQVTNGLMVTGLLAATLGLSACGRDIKTVAKYASKELGVPITVNTDSTDVCARRQLVSYYDQYKAMSSDDQLSAKRLLRAYKAINVNPTTITGHMTGEATFLHYEDSSKLLTDKRKLDGTAPKAQVDKAADGSALTITTQGAVDESDKTNYIAFSESVYDLIDSEGPVLQQAVSKNEAASVGKSYGQLIECGDLSNIHDLF